MLDPKLIRNNPDAVRQALSSRHADVSMLDNFVSADEAWRKLNFETEELKAKQNTVSNEIARLKKDKKDASKQLAEMKQMAATIKERSEQVKNLRTQVQELALIIPQIPHPSVPRGNTSDDNLEVRKIGKPPQFSFVPKTHYEIGEKKGLMDFEAGAKISGSRFVVLKDKGALLERALINFMLDLHTKKHGYTEVFPPVLVSKESMTGTGQLPKFEEDLYKCSDDLYLIPTAEVSVTNLHRNELILKNKFPIKYVCYSPCFRREAGSYGKDVRGLIRQHQFNKVELVKFVEPKNSYPELESLTSDAEEVLKQLGLHYRVVMLCTGDLGFASTKTYDLEVWFPAEAKFREISSCSNFEDFQARRMNIRYRESADSKPEFLHTLNGSGLAIGRTAAAILENYQQKDGSVVIPEVLHPYMGGNSKL